MFDFRKYWIERGEYYIHEQRLAAKFYREQEEFLIDTLKSINPETVLDVACGFGRISSVIAAAFPSASIVGLDISPHQVKNARDRLRSNDASFYVWDVTTMSMPILLRPGGVAPGSDSRYDVAVAMEFFLHLPLGELTKVLDSIKNSSKVLVHDFDPWWGSDDKVAEHCFWHPYAEIHSERANKYGTPLPKVRTRGAHGIMVVNQ